MQDSQPLRNPERVYEMRFAMRRMFVSETTQKGSPEEIRVRELQWDKFEQLAYEAAAEL